MLCCLLHVVLKVLSYKHQSNQSIRSLVWVVAPFSPMDFTLRFYSTSPTKTFTGWFTIVVVFSNPSICCVLVVADDSLVAGSSVTVVHTIHTIHTTPWCYLPSWSRLSSLHYATTGQCLSSLHATSCPTKCNRTASCPIEVQSDDISSFMLSPPPLYITSDYCVHNFCGTSSSTG